MRRPATSPLLRFLLPLVCGLAALTGYGQTTFYNDQPGGEYRDDAVTTGNDLTLTGSALGRMIAVISGSGSVTKNGTGTWSLENRNTYTGGTFVNDGTLELATQNALPTSGLLTIYGGVVHLGALYSQTVAGLSGTGGTLQSEVDASNLFTTTQSIDTTFSGAIKNLRLRLSGSGTLTLAGSTDNESAYATVSSGALVLAKDSTSTVHAIGSGLVINTGGTVKLGGTGGDQIYYDAPVTLNSGGTFDLAGRSEGVGKLTGSGTITNSAASTTSTLTVGENNSDFTFGGLLQNGVGTLALTKAGSGTLTLSGANTFTGATTLSGGTLVLAHSLALQNSTLTFSGSNGALSFGTLTAATLGGLSGNKNLALGTATAVALTIGAGNASSTYSGVLSGTGSLTKTGSGTLTLSGANTYTGGTTVNQGELALTSTGSLAAAGTLTINGGTVRFSTANLTVAGLSGTGGALIGTTGAGALTVNQSNATTFSGTVQSAHLNLSGPGTLTLAGSADNSFGAATVNSGTLVLAKTSTSAVHAIGTGLTINNGGTAQLAGTGGDQIYFGATVVVNSGGILDLAGRSEGVGTFSGSGTVTNSAASTTSTLTVGQDNSTFLFGGLLQNGAGTLALTKSGTGTLTLSDGNTYTGGTNLNAGTLAVGSDTALGTAALVLNGGALQSSGGARTLTNAVSLNADTVISGSNALTLSGPVTLNGFKSLNITNAAQTTISASIGESSPSIFIKQGTGELQLMGANTYTGGTFIQSGTVRINNTSGSAFGTGAVTVASGATLAGSGSFTGALQLNGTYAPGNSPGTQSTGSQTWNGGASLIWDLNNAIGTAGTNWDLLNISGSLTLNATAGSPFTVFLKTVDAFDAAVAAANFNSGTNYTFTFVNTTSGITGFSPDIFAINTSGFVNSLDGTWSIAQNANSLNLVYTASAIPEPGTYAALAGGAMLAFAFWRRRTRRTRV